MRAECREDSDIRITLIGKSNFEYFRSFIPKKEAEEKPLQDELLMFGAVYKGRAAGVLVLGIREELAEIMWIFVPPEFQNLGIAEKLMSEIITYASRLHIKSFFAAYSIAFEGSRNLDSLFTRCGFKIGAIESFDYRFSFREFVELPGFKRAVKSEVASGRYRFIPLEHVPPTVIINSPIKTGYDLNACERNLSILAFREKTLAGVFLVRDVENRYNLEWLENYSGDTVVIKGLLVKACLVAESLFASGKVDPEKIVSFQCIGTSGRAMVEKLFVNGPTETVWFHRAFLEVGR